MKTTLLILALALATGGRAQTAIDYRDYLHQSGFSGIHAENLTVHDDILYASTMFGLTCCDVSEPGTLVHLGGVAIVAGITAVAVTGSVAYGVTGDYGFDFPKLTVVDVSDPSAPAILGSADLPVAASDVAAAGDLVLVACYSEGIVVFDVADPAAPQNLGAVPIGSTNGLATAGRWAFAATGGELHVLDLDAPGLPEAVGSVAIPGGGASVAVSGTTAHVVGPQGLFVVDCADPWHPYRQGDTALYGSVWQVAAQDGIAYVVIRNHGLRTIAVDDPWSPRPIGGLLSTRFALGVAVVGPTVYLACFDERPTEQPGCGIMIIDADEPASPAPVGTLDLGATAHDLCVIDHHAYVITDPGPGFEDRLRVIDVSDPSTPRTVATAPLPAGAVQLSAAPPYVVVGYGGGKLQILDASDPLAITPLGEISLPTNLNTFETAGHYAYAGVGYSQTGAILGVDFTQPAFPQIYYQSSFGGTGALATDGEHLLVAGLHGEIQPWFMLVALDISDPPSVYGDGIIHFGNEYPGNLAVAGDRVVMTGGIGELEMPWPHLRCIDISVADAPQLCGWTHLARWAGDVALHEGVAYVGLGDEDCGALQVYSAADLAEPWLVGSAETPGALRSLTVHDSLIYGLARPSTLVILPTQIGGTTAVADRREGVAAAGLAVSVHPNPANPRASISFRLAATARVKVAVYDPRGAAVATVVAREFSAGEHTIVWDGRDARGRNAASGVYSVRITAGEVSTAAKVVLVR